MNIKQLTINSHINNLTIVNKSIVHLILDFDVKLEDVIYNLGLNLSNCSAIVCPRGVFKIGNINYDLTKRYNLMKVNLQKLEDVTKKVNVVLKVKEIPENKYIIQDHFDTTLFFKYYIDKKNPQQLAKLFIEHLANLYKDYKRQFPSAEHHFLIATNGSKFVGKENEEILSIIDIIHTFPVIEKEIKEQELFDGKFLFVITNQNSLPSIFVIMLRDNNETHISRTNIQKIYKELESLTKLYTPITSGIENLVAKEIINKTEVNTQEKTLEIKPEKLAKLSKYIDVKNKVVLNNITNSVNNYLKQSKVNLNTADEDDLTELVFKSIHFTLHGTDKLNNEYIEKPELLLSKFYQSDYYTKKIESPVLLNNYSIDVGNIITLKEVSAPVRKEYEFNENIHKNVRKLFETLTTTKDYPIKILNFDYEYNDDYLNRIITYKITVQNTSGGYDKPYEIKVQIPRLVNNKYFVLKGKNYIIANQMFLHPITKTAKNECRFLSNYSIITLQLVNMKFDFSDLISVFNYFETKYADKIKNINKNKKGEYISIEFNDSKNTVIDLYDEKVCVKTDEFTLSRNSETNNFEIVYNSGEVEELKVGKYEFIYNELSRILKEFNPRDTFIKSSKSIPYFRIHIQGIHLPLILYLAQQLGLLNALTKVGIEYSIGVDPAQHITSKSVVSMPLSNGKKLYVYCKTYRDELIANGLLTIKTNINEEDLNSRNAFDYYINSKFGSRATYNLDMSAMYHIDTITRELLEYENLPTNLIDIITTVMIDKLLNDKVSDVNDLNIHRSRQSEIITSLLYKELRQAHSRYVQNVLVGETDAKLFVAEDWIINSLLGANPSSKGNSVLNFSSTFNPVSEIKEDTKVIRSGPGGIPNKRSYKVKHRDIHESHYGNIGGNDTTEGPDIGINIKHSLTVLINNKYGFYQNKDISKINGWEVVSIGEAMSPFINSMDAGRMILAATHAGQVVPIKNPDIPIVSTGANFIIPQISSNKFCISAENNGVVIDKKDGKYIEVQYEDGTKKIYDISTRITATKRSTYLPQHLNSLEKGETFKKGQLLAWSNLFNGEAYTHGKNLTMAVMNYGGFSHEDGYVVSENIVNDYNVSYYKEVVVIIPENTNILKFVNKINTNTNLNDVLIEFTFEDTVDNYLDVFNILNIEKNESEDEEAPNSFEADNEELYVSTGKTIQVKSPGGVIKDIKIYLNQRKRISPVLLKFHKDVSKEIKNTINNLTKYSKDENEVAKALDNIDTTQLKIGKHKHKNIEFTGAKIVYYIENNQDLQVGDKMSNRYGAKGIITKIIPKELTPKGEYSGNIDIFLSPSGLLGRKNVAVLKELYIGKILMNMNRILKEKIESKTTIPEIKRIIADIYKLLDTTQDQRIYKSISKKLSEIKDNDLKQQILTNKFKFIIIYEPFENISFQRIKQAAELLNIPLEEKVFIPELNTWTKNPVPVGCQYIQLMEQFGKDYHAVRSTGKYTMLTGQPVKGKKNIGGQTVGPLDVYALLNYESKNIIKELMTFKSDDFYNKRVVYSSILDNGKLADMPKETGGGKSTDLKNIFILGLGLYVTR